VGADRVAKALVRLTKSPKLDYLGLTPCEVLEDHGDNLFSLQPDDRKLPPFVRIPLRTFAPGIRLEVEPGARAQVGFENGDPGKPVVLMFEAGAIKRLHLPAELEIVLGNLSAAVPVARVGDEIKVVLYIAPSLAGKISTIPSVEPQPIGPPLPYVPLEVTGVITEGSSLVKAS
jgi:hypothetical protein